MTAYVVGGLAEAKRSYALSGDAAGHDGKGRGVSAASSLRSIRGCFRNCEPM